MKKLTTSVKIVAVSSLAAVTMVGCGATASSVAPSAVQSQSSAQSQVISQSAAAVGATTSAEPLAVGSLDSMIKIEGLYSWDEAIKTAQSTATGRIVSIDYENESGQAVYSIELMESNGFTTEVEISAINGNVVRTEKDHDIDSDAVIINTATVTLEKAIQTALAQSSGSKFKSAELDASWNEPVYKVEIVETTGVEKQIVINAITGEVSAVRNEVSGSTTITIDQAEANAKTASGGTIVLYTTLEYDDGRYYYQVNLVSADGRGYEVEIDGTTGNVTDLDYD